MTNEISIFNFKSTPVRTSIQDGEVWFCLVDVCDSLNLKRGSRVIDRLSEAGVRKTYVSYPSGKKEAIFINESNLYKLIFKSNKPAAVQFGDWVTGEVLPTIRKTGGYGAVDMKAIGGMVKRCVNKALSDFLSNELPIAEDEDVLRKKYYNVNDREMMDVFQRWYWSRNYDVRKVIDSQQQRIEELEAKLRMVKQAIN
nr:MAG TPA: hypothetical protein [Caudoviricetes sp.]